MKTLAHCGDSIFLRPVFPHWRSVGSPNVERRVNNVPQTEFNGLAAYWALLGAVGYVQFRVKTKTIVNYWLVWRAGSLVQ